MKIPQDLPQFSLRKTLIIVTGTHETCYISAYQGEAIELHDYKVEKVTYSDREGHFLRRAFGYVLGSGSVYEPKKEQQIIEFLSEFETHTKKVMRAIEPEDIILLAPSHIANQIKEKLSPKEKDIVSLSVHGNYIKKDTPTILKIISKKLNEKYPTTPISEEAQKILNKTNNK
jgi:predicted metal-dependent hydrolase